MVEDRANDSENFDRQFSTTLSPGFYGLRYDGHAFVNENSTSNNVTASLDIVMTLSPVGDCSDGLDNDGDSLADLDDGGCVDGTDPAETTASPVPALGAPGLAAVVVAMGLAGLLALSAWRRARRRT